MFDGTIAELAEVETQYREIQREIAKEKEKALAYLDDIKEGARKSLDAGWAAPAVPTYSQRISCCRSWTDKLNSDNFDSSTVVEDSTNAAGLMTRPLRHVSVHVCMCCQIRVCIPRIPTYCDQV